MSVTVVSTMSKPSPTAAEHPVARPGRDGSDDASASPGFASLLSGQLAPGVPPAVAAPDLALSATSDAADPELPTDNAVAGLLAALGLLPADGARASAERSDTASATINALPSARLAGDASASSENSQDALSRLALAAQTDRPTAKVVDDGSAGKAVPPFAGKPAIDDKSAIIAAASSSRAAAASALEAPTVRRIALEAVSGAVPSAIPREAPLAVTTPVRDQGWAAEVADKIVWLASNDRQSAKLTLNPAHMGPLEISLNIDKGHATAAFFSASAEVRDALEAALPRLREMFASAGIALGQANVGAESFSQQAGGGSGADGRGAAPWSTDAAILAGESPADLALTVPRGAFNGQWNKGMVDTFA